MSDRVPHFLDGGGKAAAEILAFDWSNSPLGCLEEWPASLKTAVGMMLASLFPKAIFWGPQHIMLHNDAFRVIMGAKPAAIGHPMSEIWSEIWDEVRPIAERAMQGDATFLEDLPLTIERGPHPELCYFTFCYSPIRDENGRVAGFIDTVIETTGKVEGKQALQTQNAELAHRIQNTLAIVASIARQTLRAAPDTDAAWDVLSARLSALAETHNLLRAGPHTRAEIGEVVRAALRPHGGDLDRFDLVGPQIMVPERQALALSLAVNELATNAIKHGALSDDRGRIFIGWDVTGDSADQLLHFNWAERGGPPVQPPSRRSFGTRLIEEVVPNDFGGEAMLMFLPEGVSYQLTGSVRWFGDTGSVA